MYIEVGQEFIMFSIDEVSCSVMTNMRVSSFGAERPQTTVNPPHTGGLDSGLMCKNSK